MIRALTAVLLAAAPAASGQVVITEIWPGGLPGQEQTPDWFELSNVGETPVTGVDTWFYDDVSNDPTENAPIIGVREIAPGESVIILASWEDDFASAEEAIAGFISVWGAENLTGVQIGVVTGGAGLSGGGDTVYVYDSNLPGAGVIATQAYMFADPSSWFWNPDTMSWNDELSQIGLFGAFESVNVAATGPDEFAVGSPGFFDGETVLPPPSVVITEIWPGGLPGQEQTADWFELTNVGTTTISGVDSWFYDDDSADPTVNDALTGVSEIAPGESVIFLASWEDDFASAEEAIAAFTAVWGADAVAGVQIGTVTGGSGLGGSGDAVFIFDGATPDAGVIASQAYLFADPSSWFWNPSTTSWNDELSVIGLFGAFQSAMPAAVGPEAFAVGSPGVIDGEGAATTIVITEIWPGGLEGSETIPDWFELTNIGGEAVTGVDAWFYDDESADPTVNDALTGVSEIGAGESVVFLTSWEDDFATAEEAIAAFTAVWGADNLTGVQIGVVTGGSGLGGGGDAVFIFDGATPGAGVIASQAYLFADPSSWFWNPDTQSWNDELSSIGFFGAFQSAAPAATGPDEFAVGSPGVIDGPDPPPTGLEVTEIWAGGLPGDETIPDWFEITNFGDVVFAGADTLFYDDESADPTVGDALLGITDIGPGETVVYLVSWEGDFATADDAIAAFTDVWGADNLAGVQIGVVDDGSGLGGGGDAVFIFDSARPGAEVVATQSYPVAGFPESYVWNPETNSWNEEIAVVGVFGAYQSLLPAATGPEAFAIGSPGVVDAPGPQGPDLDGSGTVDSADLNILLADFGCTPAVGACSGDVDGDGDSDSDDLNAILAAFGDEV